MKITVQTRGLRGKPAMTVGTMYKVKSFCYNHQKRHTLFAGICQ
jgi:hypothetical protein